MDALFAAAMSSITGVSQVRSQPGQQAIKRRRPEPVQEPAPEAVPEPAGPAGSNEAAAQATPSPDADTGSALPGLGSSDDDSDDEAAMMLELQRMQARRPPRAEEADGAPSRRAAAVAGRHDDDALFSLVHRAKEAGGPHNNPTRNAFHDRFLKRYFK